MLRRKRTASPEPSAPRWLAAGPGPCMRAYLLPPGRADCSPDCPGRQEDGTCLADILRAANRQGVEWSFDVRPHPDVDPRFGGVWVYDGPPLKKEPLPAEIMPPRPTFMCPHCGLVNEQDIANFHYWCGFCGQNAKEPPEPPE